MIDEILRRQNPDGGWPYRVGKSWTEPSAYALLALSAAPPEERLQAAVDKGLAWLRTNQLTTGGWPAQVGMNNAVWVTALVSLLGPSRLGGPAYGRSVTWTVNQYSEMRGWKDELTLKIYGARGMDASGHGGWSWVPGTAGWLTPTALSVLALDKANRLRPDGPLRDRAELGRGYLLARMCDDGGWNHGQARVLGVEAPSYPETTGLGLLALATAKPEIRAKLGKSYELARREIHSAPTVEAVSWLRMALAAHRQDAAIEPNHAVTCRDVRDHSLAVLAEAAAAGRNIFLE